MWQCGNVAEKCKYVNNNLGPERGGGGGGKALVLWSRHWLSFIAKGGLEDFVKDNIILSRGAGINQ